MCLEKVCEIKVGDRYKIKREKDVYRFLKDKVFAKSFKVFSPVLKGLPDFIVIRTQVKELPPGFYEVKYGKLSLTELQEKVIKELALSFNVFVVVYDYNERLLNFYKVYLDKNFN